MNALEANLLTAEEMSALIAFRHARGRKWKAKMRAGWERANANGALPSILYALRNSHGPYWLARFKSD